MAKKKKKTAPRYYFNEYDDSPVEKKHHQQKGMRLKKHFVRFLWLLVIIGIIAFFLSPLSRIGMIHVNGIHYLSEDDIVMQSGLNENDVSLLTFSSRIEKKLENAPLIATAKVQKSLFSGMIITIQEKSIIAYQNENEVLRVVDGDGKIANVDMSHLATIQQAPRLMQFSDETILQTFCEELAKVPEVTLAMISDIKFSPIEPYDMTRVEMDMSDGKKVYVRIEDMAAELKYYPEILDREPDACVYDINGNKVYASPCQ